MLCIFRGSETRSGFAHVAAFLGSLYWWKKAVVYQLLIIIIILIALPSYIYTLFVSILRFYKYDKQ